MVNNEGKHSEKTHAKQGFPPDRPGPYKIAASTPFDFGATWVSPGLTICVSGRKIPC